MKSEKDKEKEKKSKSRLISPSFRRGSLRDEKKKEENEEGEFHLNLISAGDYEDDDESKSPSPIKRGKRRPNPSSEESGGGKTANIAPVKHHHHDDNNEISIPDEMKVNSLPNGHVKLIASRSQAGKKEDGKTKVNQDSYLVIQKWKQLNDFNIFAVLDGHGKVGHNASQFVTKYFNLFFNKNKKILAQKTEDQVYMRLLKRDYDILTRLFRHAERDIVKNDFDPNFSGTTCVMVLQVGEKLITANVGDSRAILVKENGKKIIPLSVDQKPNDPEELKRIVSNGGEVKQYEEDGEVSGPYRVWKKGQEYPGIAMSRSIGDLVATTLGVIPEPVFTQNVIDKETNFIIIASDGVWEFLPNEKVTEIVMPYYKKDDPDGACKALINESTSWWTQEDIVVDDITVIAVFF